MKIDMSETFPHLSRAPVVEAVIDLRAKPSVPWDQDVLQKRLKQTLPGYPKTQQQRRFQGEIKAEAGKPVEQRLIDLGWTGLMFQSEDQRNVVQFQKDGFAFSRLAPYQDWEEFEKEALRLWRNYVELTSPAAIQRIGVRFVNRMLFPADSFRLDDHLNDLPPPLESLKLISAGFFHQDTMQVPETGYVVNLVRTAQPAEGTPPKIPVILDIDVFTCEPLELDETILKRRLAEMRWLKNKIFFGSITSRTKESLQ